MTETVVLATGAREPSGILHDGIAANAVLSLKEAGLSAHVDAAVLSADGALALVGWVFDPERRVSGLAGLVKAPGLLKKGYAARHFTSGAGGVQWLPVERPDVTAAIGGTPGEDRHGFVLVVPVFSPDQVPALLLEDGRYVVLPCKLLREGREAEASLERCLASGGPQLHAACQAALGESHPLSRFVADSLVDDSQPLRQLAVCDQALLVDGQVLLLTGWIGARAREIASLSLVAATETFELHSRLTRYPRPDLDQAFPRTAGEALGFIAAVPVAVPPPGWVELQIVCHSGARERCRMGVMQLDWKELYGRLQRSPSLVPGVLQQLQAAFPAPGGPSDLASRLSRLREALFSDLVPGLPTFAEQPQRAIAAIDRVYPLGEAGMLIYGWKLTPHREPLDVTVHDEGGRRLSVKDAFIAVPRDDVVEIYRERFPETPRRCGFILHAPLPTEVGDARAICFHFAEWGDLWLRLPLDQRDMRGTLLIKEMLAAIPQPGQLRHHLHDIFDRGLGAALEAVNQKRLAEAQAVEESLEIRQYGEAPREPKVSVIVPLYGRADFMRYQLAHFADDPDLRQCDLIYVVDDPRIVEEVLDLAGYQWLFDVPFRVVWYDRNLGFAGANNVAARLAKAPRLLLMNSDVIPIEPGWISRLNAAMDDLPDAGAVAPLLLYADGSIQHAGMYPLRISSLPGFLLNTHPYQGTRCYAEDEGPSEHPLLSAACLMLNSADFLELGGFDEGYVIGDFEDSDLCLALRKRGKRLFLVPSARAWHLERQSQTIDLNGSTRQLVTFFNAWRYQSKIRSGEIHDPESGLESFAYGAALKAPGSVSGTLEDREEGR